MKALQELRESGIGLPHSTTLARIRACHSFREVEECGSPMPLFPSTMMPETVQAPKS
jgi:hypothetical protein